MFFIKTHNTITLHDMKNGSHQIILIITKNAIYACEKTKTLNNKVKKALTEKSRRNSTALALKCTNSHESPYDERRKSANSGQTNMAQPAHFTPPKGVKNIARAVAGLALPCSREIARETKKQIKPPAQHPQSAAQYPP